MNDTEIEFLKKKIIELTTENQEGVNIEAILDWLDYVNRVRYSKEEVRPILENLASENKIKSVNSLYFSS